MARSKAIRERDSAPRSRAHLPDPPAQKTRALWESRQGRRLLLGLILALAAFLRLYRLDSVPFGLHSDEAMNGNLAQQVLDAHECKVFYAENNGTEGLYINLMAPFVALGGNTRRAVRLESAALGILTVWGIYLLGMEMFSTPVGLLAAWLTAVSFWHLDFSRIATRGISAPLFLVWAMFLLLAGLRRVRQGIPATGVMLAAGVVYGLGFHTYVPYRITPALIIVVLAYDYIRARNAPWRASFYKASLVFLASAAAAVLPLIVYFIRTPAELSARAGQVSVFRADHPTLQIATNVWKTAAMFFLQGDRNWRHNYDARPELYFPVGILFVAGIAMAAMECSRFRRPVGSDSASPSRGFPCALALGWLAAAAVPEVLSNEGIPHAFRAILMIPPVFLLAASGAWALYSWLARGAPPRLCAVILAALLFWIGWDTWHTYFDLWAANPKVADAFQSQLTDLAHKLKEVPAATPKFLIWANPQEGIENGIPVSLQPVAFLTATYNVQSRQDLNYHYLTPRDFPDLAGGSLQGKALCDALSKRSVAGVVVCLSGDK